MLWRPAHPVSFTYIDKNFRRKRAIQVESL